MPYASVRTSRNTRIGGGPLFWLILGWIVGPIWLMGQVAKAAIQLTAHASRSAASQQARGTVTTSQVADPEDAIPDWAQPVTQDADDPRTHPLLVALGIACAVLLTLAAIGAMHSR